MLKSVFAAVLVVGFAMPVQAQTTSKMECTKAEMDKMETKMKGMTDKSKQDTAMKEMKMAEDMMKKNDTKGCMTHMENASKAMGTL